MVPPMRKRSETLLLLPLLPIFLIGMFPMLLIGMLGSAGLVIFGILLIRVGLAGTMEAHGDFNQEIIVHGYAAARSAPRRPPTCRQRRAWRVLCHVAGIAMILPASGHFLRTLTLAPSSWRA